MPIKLPRKFERGQKLENADVCGELFVWPEGYFQYAIDIRSRGQEVTAAALRAIASTGTELEFCPTPD